MACSSVGSSV